MIDERKHSLLAIALAVAAGIVLGTLAVGAVLSILSALFHIVGWLIHLAIVAAVVAFVAAGVWWLMFGRRTATNH
ncbi:MAG: hypothetical protein ACRDZ8_17685 [Acidimicrobiales bacterium]